MSFPDFWGEKVRKLLLLNPVKNWRIGISFLLLLIYSLGMLHDLVPHFHLSDQVSQKKAVLVHEHHISDDGVWYHGDSDRSLYDFLMCLLQHSDHPDFGDEKVPVTQPHFESGTSDVLLTGYLPFTLPTVSGFACLRIADQVRFYDRPYLPPEHVLGSQQSRRGPPAGFHS